MSNPDLITAARDWLADLSFQEFLTSEELEAHVATLSPEEILRAVERHWDGGLKDFITTL